MKAIVFAAGLGTRLGEFTKSHPKALVEVGGQTMLQRVLLKLRDYGIEEAVVNVHHFADQIVDYLKANGNFGMQLHISREDELLLETGGGLLAAARYLDGDDRQFVVHNADILTDFPLDEMVAAHRSRGSEATLLVAARDTQRYLLFDAGCRMRGWTNIATGELRPGTLASAEGFDLRAFGGVHVFSLSLLHSLKAYNDMLVASGAEADSRGLCRFSIMNFYIDSCAQHSIGGYEPKRLYRWCDIGKPASLDEARAIFS